MRIVKNFKLKIKTLLLWSQKYLKTDMIYVARGGSWLVLSQIVVAFASFLLTIAFANLLSRGDYGLYRYVLSIAAFLSIATLPGMNSAITRGVAKGNEASFLEGTKTQLKWGVLGGLAGLGIAGYYFLQGNTELMIAFLFTGIFVPLMNPFNSFSAYLNGKARFRAQGLAEITVHSVSISGIICALFFTQNILIIIFLYFFLYTLTNSLLFFFIFFQFNSKSDPDPETLSFGKHLSLMGLLGPISKHADKIILWHFLGPLEVALYSLAQVPIERIRTVFAKTVGSLAQPKFSQNDLPTLQKTLPSKSLKVFIFFIPLVLVYIFLAPYFYRFIFPEYLDSVKYTQALAISLLSSPLMFFGTALIAQKKQKELYISKISSRVVFLVVMLILTWIYGVWGVVVSQILFYIGSGLLSFILFKQAKNL